MKETRNQFTPPPLPKADVEGIMKWIRQMTSILPAHLWQMQQTLLESQAQTYDIAIPVPDDEPTQDAEYKSDITESCGIISRPTFTDEGVNDLGFTEFTCMLRTSDDIEANLVYFTIDAGTVEITQDSDIYVGLEYNSGSPQVVARGSDTFTGTDEFRMAVIYNDGGTLHIKSSLQRAGNFQYWVTHRLQEVEGIQRAQFYGAGGIILEDGGSNWVKVSGGELYEALEEYEIEAFDSTNVPDVPDTFDRYYRDSPNGWVVESAVRTWPNTEYDDGSGTLATIGNNKWASVWFYIETDGGLVMVYGRNEYVTEAAANSEDPPNSLPPRLNLHGTLIGRMIFQKSATSATVETAFDEVYGGSSVTSHSALSGLSGDDHGQYALLDGRPLGQTYYGGTITGENLEMYGNFAKGGTRYVRIENVYLHQNEDQYNHGITMGIASPSGALVHIYNTRDVGGGRAVQLLLEDASGITPRDVDLQLKNTTLQWDITNVGSTGYLEIVDVTNSKTPFTIEANSPSNTLYVDINGRVGVNTNSPDNQLDVSSGATTVAKIQSTANNQAVAINLTDPNGNWQIQKSTGHAFILRDVTNTTNVVNIVQGANANSLYIDVSGHVGLRTTPATSAALEISGTDGALLLPRLTTVQRNTLTAVAGMIIYNTTTGVIEGYEGAAWVNL